MLLRNSNNTHMYRPKVKVPYFSTSHKSQLLNMFLVCFPICVCIVFYRKQFRMPESGHFWSFLTAEYLSLSDGLHSPEA